MEKNWKHANQIAAGAWDVEHVHELKKLPTPNTYIFSSWGLPPPTILFFRTLKWDMENINWKHANQIVAGAWDVEHEHELNKLPTPHTYIFSSFEVGKRKRQRKKM